MRCLRLGLPLQGFHAGRAVGDYAAEIAASTSQRAARQPELADRLG